MRHRRPVPEGPRARARARAADRRHARDHVGPRAGQRRLRRLWRGRSDTAKFTLRGKSAAAVDAAVERIQAAFPGVTAAHHDTHVVVTRPCRRGRGASPRGSPERGAGDRPRRPRPPHGALQGGRPRRRRWPSASASPRWRGTHAIGHTRMATELAVTTDGAHPYSTGADQCLVHNGSLSNHNNLRRVLVREGFAFETENDTEVAAGYLVLEDARGHVARRRARRAASPTSTASTPSSSAPRTASACSATASPASRR